MTLQEGASFLAALRRRRSAAAAPASDAQLLMAALIEERARCRKLSKLAAAARDFAKRGAAITALWAALEALEGAE